VQPPPSCSAASADTAAQDLTLPPEVLAAVTCPTLILQARPQAGKARDHALVEALVPQLTGVEGGARVFSVNAGLGYMSVLEPGVVNKTFLKFLAALAHLDSPPVSPSPGRMRRALLRLAELTARPALAERDPASPLSFSMLPDADVALHEARLREYAEGMSAAFNPLGPGGRPMRKCVAAPPPPPPANARAAGSRTASRTSGARATSTRRG
jgi:predicted methyltransferase